MTWIQKWPVPGSKDNIWTVAINDKGEYGCSCPVWKFKRQECKHIKIIKQQSVFGGATQQIIIPRGTGAVTKVVAKTNVTLNFIPAVKVNRKFNFDE